MSIAQKTQQKTAAEVRNVAISFAGKLDTGEVLTGTPTVTEVTTSDLTLASKAVSTAALTINGVSVAIGEAVQFSVSGGTIGQTYEITATATTTATPAQTLKGTVKLKIVAETK